MWIVKPYSKLDKTRKKLEKHSKSADLLPIRSFLLNFRWWLSEFEANRQTDRRQLSHDLLGGGNNLPYIGLLLKFKRQPEIRHQLTFVWLKFEFRFASVPLGGTIHAEVGSTQILTLALDEFTLTKDPVQYCECHYLSPGWTPEAPKRPEIMSLLWGLWGDSI